MTKIKANPDAEIGVLGTLIEDGNPNSLLVKKSFMNLHEDLFYNPSYKELFKLIKKHYSLGVYFDAVTLFSTSIPEQIHNVLEKAVIGTYFSNNLLEHHIQELQRNYALRNMTNIMCKSSKDCMDEPITLKAMDILRDGIKKAGDASISNQNYGLSFTEIQKLDQEGKFKGQSVIRCGIKQFETIKNSSLITIAGASGVGKTFFSIYVMDEIAKYQPDKQILFFSLEMKSNEIWERYLYLRNIDKDKSELLPKGKVFDMPRIDIDHIETISHSEAIHSPISVIVVDYLALVTSRNKFDREDLRLSDISQRLAALAMELNCIVICLSQINRDASKRQKDDRCPYPTDVADSVGSVRSSSLWIGIDRPETYDDSADKKNLFVAKCRKSRFGNQFEAWFNFNDGLFVERIKPFWNSKTKSSFDDVINNFE